MATFRPEILDLCTEVAAQLKLMLFMDPCLKEYSHPAIQIIIEMLDWN